MHLSQPQHWSRDVSCIPTTLRTMKVLPAWLRSIQSLAAILYKQSDRPTQLWHVKVGKPALRNCWSRCPWLERAFGTRRILPKPCKVYGQIEAWQNSKIEREHSYVFLVGLRLMHTWAGGVWKVAVLISLGIMDRFDNRNRTLQESKQNHP